MNINGKSPGGVAPAEARSACSEGHEQPQDSRTEGQKQALFNSTTFRLKLKGKGFSPLPLNGKFPPMAG
jgi:hypothetical protein